MNLQQLITFYWVHRSGGFRKAAEKLHTTQPAVSSRIQALEASLGVKLMERGPGGVRLTPKGSELIGYAEKVIGITELIKERIGDASGLQGTIRIGVSETIVQSWLPQFLSELNGTYPKLDVELTVDVSINLRDALLNRALDLALLMGPISDYTVTNLDLPDFALSWYIAERHREACRNLGPQELFSTFPIVTYARNTRPFREIKTRMLELYGFEPRMFPSASLAACMHMVRNGIGIGTLPIDMVKNAGAPTGLIRLHQDWDPEPLRFTASFVEEPPDSIAKNAAKLATAVARVYAADKNIGSISTRKDN